MPLCPYRAGRATEPSWSQTPSSYEVLQNLKLDDVLEWYSSQEIDKKLGACNVKSVYTNFTKNCCKRMWDKCVGNIIMGLRQKCRTIWKESVWHRVFGGRLLWSATKPLGFYEIYGTHCPYWILRVAQRHCSM